MSIDDAEMIESDFEIEVDKASGSKKIRKKIGDYIFYKEIGKGAFAIVYKGK